MPDAFVQQIPRTPDEWRRLWSFTEDPFRTRRRPTRVVQVGDVGIGGSNPIRIQSMTIADTLDTATVVEEIATLARAGCEIVRVTAPNRKAAENLGPIRAALRQRGVEVPLVADVHFTPQAALIATEHVEKVRINPGNYADRKHFKKWEYSDSEYAEELERLEAAFRPLVLRCKERGVAMRIGTNHGSLSDRILNRFGDTPRGMVESALEFVHICAHHGYHDLVLSMKASDVKVMIAAYRLLARRMRELHMDYPLHLGVTEAGSGLAARVKSAIGIATLLADGIGDTLRVSLTEDSVHEIPVARALADVWGPGEASLDTRSGAPMDPAPARAPETRARAAPSRVPPWDPCFYSRRPVMELGHGTTRLAKDQPPRIEWVCCPPLHLEDLRHWLRASMPRIGRAHREQAVDLVLLSLPGAPEAARAALTLLLPALADAGDSAWGLELSLEAWGDAELTRQIESHPWRRLSLRLPDLEAASLRAAGSWRPAGPVQYTLPSSSANVPEAGGRLGRAMLDGVLPFGALSLRPTQRPPAGLHAWRRLFAAWPAMETLPPAVLRGVADAAHPIDAHVTRQDLETAWELGALLADGIGDAVQIEGADFTSAGALAREILQSTRARLSKADFIACPSCGRTQFDLQSTTARIQSRLQHLKGLKIAVMGCIVNGPGEMADADFGYVGSGPGRIDLYVGHERVERNVPEAEAVSRLVELIQRRGRWVEPPAPGNAEPGASGPS